MGGFAGKSIGKSMGFTEICGERLGECLGELLGSVLDDVNRQNWVEHEAWSTKKWNILDFLLSRNTDKK